MSDDQTPTGALTEQDIAELRAWVAPFSAVGLIPTVEAIVARHVAELEAELIVYKDQRGYLASQLEEAQEALAEAERAQYDCDAEALRRNAMHQRLLAEAEQKGAREALLAAADDWNAEYERVTFTHGSRANKIRAALRMATGLARDRAAQIGPTP